MGATRFLPKWPNSLDFKLNIAPKNYGSLVRGTTENKAQIKMETAVIFCKETVPYSVSPKHSYSTTLTMGHLTTERNCPRQMNEEQKPDDIPENWQYGFSLTMQSHLKASVIHTHWSPELV